MDSKKTLIFLGAVFLVIIAVVGLISTFSGTAAAEETEDGSENLRTISVSATSEISATPNKAEFTVSIETDAKTAKQSQQDNAELSAKVIAALKQAGVADKDIETTGYYLNERYEWNEPLRKNQSIGYRTTHSIKVTTKDTTKAGDLIDAAVLAGATNVSSVNFTLDDETIERLKLEALELASAKAAQKANAMARGAGVSIDKLQSMSETGDYYPIYANTYKSYDMATMESSAGAASTEVIAGDITISMSVSATYLIK